MRAVPSSGDPWGCVSRIQSVSRSLYSLCVLGSRYRISKISLANGSSIVPPLSPPGKEYHLLARFTSAKFRWRRAASLLRFERRCSALQEVLSRFEQRVQECIELMFIKAQLEELVLDDERLLLVSEPDCGHRAMLVALLGQILNRHEVLLEG